MSELWNGQIGVCHSCGGQLLSDHKCPDKALLEMAERLDSMPLNSETMKQIKEFKANHQAEAIAKFLGIDVPKTAWPYMLNGIALWTIIQQKAYVVRSELEFEAWLDSDAGTVAMILKLNKTYDGRHKLHLIFACEEQSDADINKELQAAILEVLK